MKRLLTVLAVLAGALVALPGGLVASAAVPAGFTDTAVISGLSAPTQAAFAPDGRVFIAEKSGIIKVYDGLGDTTPTVFADLRPQVHDFWDRGLLGLALDPQFPATPHVYVLYTYDYLGWGDVCPDPPGATNQGCLVQGRLSRLIANGNTASAEQVVLTDWCQQYPSHSIGSLAFGPDGALYVSGGDGASFNFADWGQVGNPCTDPPGAAGTNLSPPTAEGGALRSQSVRRASTQPRTLDGTVIRINPSTGAGMPGNPFASSTDANARRVIAYGLRNPFRMGIRPGTNELWVGDVGWGTWEEVNRISNIGDGVAENFGWPCYEGNARQSGYDNANLNSCENLYGTGQNAPHLAYNHSNNVVSGDGCPTGSSAVGGIAFENNSNYPAEYRGALFFADASRGCIWAMRRNASGTPDPSMITPFVTGANVPVHVLSGPGGDIFYVTLNGGQLRRVSYPTGNRPPTAVATANPTSGALPLNVQFNGSGSSDPDAQTLAYAWDLDGDGAFDDSTAVNPTWTYTTDGIVSVKLRVTDPGGLSDTATVVVTAGNPVNPDPVPVIDSPDSSLRWKVGDPITFSGHAMDAQDGSLPASALSWQLILQHCPSNCHSHTVQSFLGAGNGSFSAPDHEYPSYLELVLTARDSSGRTGTTSVRLDPRTVQLTFASNPSGRTLTHFSQSATAPFTRTVIVGSANSISAPSPQGSGLVRYCFRSWSDGGAQSHTIVAPASPTTYTANFRTALLSC
ncbi:PQQ-dependent sugar dehydrogenase [Kibdelosporangium aridum]|uniref:Glucose/arabinose dehydrogenase, beta-propeller fold n=1 Tax=Kibdelosporangium aridum TaxID=2030 RepID=A0A1W2FB80_KIBAR|nr:PQQ-dependent sugar dehydrogenase [Kibdelosporangium aridum]SMD19185.1 Glucose/arabinose dehydrogenase, beta-propeller fold [Kibdelosporangium aridum]